MSSIFVELISFFCDNGNIIEKRTYTYTLCDTSDLEEKSYTYDENLYSAVGDRVERVNGYFVTYDDIGRVSQYKYMDCTWNKGKLIGLGSNTFTYDYKGRRTSKNGITFTYDSQGRLVEQSNGIKFIYDDTGVAGMIQGGSLYLYEKDAQGNIISLLDSQGFVVVRYEYDAWGVCKVYDTNDNVITQHDSVDANPFRYRGYYYDVDTGLYYLPARYYDPTTGRFISADDIEYADPETINGLNLYAYCGNNPVMNIDPTGHDFWETLFNGIALIFTAIGAILVSVATFGIATPLAVSIVAVVTLGAGTLTGINGIATIIEAGTGYNFIRDGFFNDVLGLSDDVYDWYVGITSGIAIAGTTVCSIWNITNPIKGFTKHGKQSALNHDRHGVNAKSMQNAVRKPLKIENQPNGTIKHIGKNAVVVLNKAGKVVTTYAKNHFGWRLMLSLWLGLELHQEK